MATALLGQGDGFPGHDPGLSHRLVEATARRQPGEALRTRHLDERGRPVFTNRLVLEASPYLRQHAHNPVDWYAWGEEAFATAAREGKPIFLSIGYSTCHWCHVMEEESFDDLEVAEALNRAFVAVKVDREERPDLDEIYMTALQLMGRSGGWPMTSFLTSDGKPFFAATYLPKDKLLEVADVVERTWRDDRASLERTGTKLAEAVDEMTRATGEAVELDAEASDRAARALLARADRKWGGFRGAPKFPREAELLFVANRALATGDRDAAEWVEVSLDRMARGGIFDQVGGGFHRYSTDERWLVPHFEKTLYNQAQLARAYLAGYRLTGRRFFARVARQTLDYVLRDLRSPEGLFYSATDADSEGQEGLYFLWTWEGLEAALPPEERGLARRIFGVDGGASLEERNVVLRSRPANERDDPILEGLSLGVDSNILYLPHPLDVSAHEERVTVEDLLARLDSIRRHLLAARYEREPPLRDEKIVTAWNGMMLTALCEASLALDEPRYREAAIAAGESLWATARRSRGRLWRVHLGGDSAGFALQEDYAFLAEGLLSLYDLTRDERWLARAEEVLDGMIEQFWDEEQGGFFATSRELDPRLIARPKSPRDGAVPSGNSAALRALVMAAQRSGEIRYRTTADRLVVAFSRALHDSPQGFAYLWLGRSLLAGVRVEEPVWVGRGAVAIAASAEGDADGLRLRVDLDVRPGWHVNSAQPLADDLIATSLTAGSESAWSVRNVAYPPGERVTLGFRDDELSVYEGRVALSARVVRSAAGARSGPPDRVLPVELTLQPCNDRLCLRPETIELRVALAPLLRAAEESF